MAQEEVPYGMVRVPRLDTYAAERRRGLILLGLSGQEATATQPLQFQLLLTPGEAIQLSRLIQEVALQILND